MSGPLLDVEDLSVRFDTDEGTVHAVDRMSLTLEPRQVLGIVGESGCGKSVTSMAAMGLLPPTARIGGSIRLSGRELVGATEKELRHVRDEHFRIACQRHRDHHALAHAAGKLVRVIADAPLG